jgi:hypothetical protein
MRVSKSAVPAADILVKETPPAGAYLSLILPNFVLWFFGQNLKHFLP